MSTITGPTSNRFMSQRLRLNYAEWGDRDAPLLILQHGGRDHCRSWDWVARELMRDWRIICPDLRGHGDSEWSPEGCYALDAYVYDFAQLIHTLGYDQATIIGHSLGGNIATRFTGLYPDKVRKFINIEGLDPVESTQPDKGKSTPADRLRAWIETKRETAGRMPKRYTSLTEACARMKEVNGFLTLEQARHLTVHGTTRNEDGTWSWKYDNYLHVWQIASLTPEMLNEIWAAITCPVLLLYGKDSFAVSPAIDGRLERLPTARLIEYENAGHWLHHDQFDRFMADVKTFLAE
ncbi:alpha/beta fold hydrolase [Novosphingobium colocasiae]|uniref:alpha/beta fold hydrolase n=1 Tax=Novosphingobium colocasiae TaxID=1256513 RepID=UPI0035AE2A7A